MPDNFLAWSDNRKWELVVTDQPNPTLFSIFLSQMLTLMLQFSVCILHARLVTRNHLQRFILFRNFDPPIQKYAWLYSLLLRTRDRFMRILLGSLNCRRTIVYCRYIKLNYTFFRIKTHFYGIPRITRSNAVHNAVPLNADGILTTIIKVTGKLIGFYF